MLVEEDFLMTPRVLGVASFLDTWLVLIKACSCLKVYKLIVTVNL